MIVHKYKLSDSYMTFWMRKRRLSKFSLLTIQAQEGRMECGGKFNKLNKLLLNFHQLGCLPFAAVYVPHIATFLQNGIITC